LGEDKYFKACKSLDAIPQDLKVIDWILNFIKKD